MILYAVPGMYVQYIGVCCDTEGLDSLDWYLIGGIFLAPCLLRRPATPAPEHRAAVAQTS
jgi:hypothetical protein